MNLPALFSLHLKLQTNDWPNSKTSCCQQQRLKHAKKQLANFQFIHHRDVKARLLYQASLKKIQNYVLHQLMPVDKVLVIAHHHYGEQFVKQLQLNNLQKIVPIYLINQLFQYENQKFNNTTHLFSWIKKQQFSKIIIVSELNSINEAFLRVVRQFNNLAIDIMMLINAIKVNKQPFEVEKIRDQFNHDSQWLVWVDQNLMTQLPSRDINSLMIDYFWQILALNLGQIQLHSPNQWRLYGYQIVPNLCDLQAIISFLQQKKQQKNCHLIVHVLSNQQCHFAQACNQPIQEVTQQIGYMDHDVILHVRKVKIHQPLIYLWLAEPLVLLSKNFVQLNQPPLDLATLVGEDHVKSAKKFTLSTWNRPNQEVQVPENHIINHQTVNLGEQLIASVTNLVAKITPSDQGAIRTKPPL